MISLYKIDGTEINVPDTSDVLLFEYLYDKSQSSLNQIDQVIYVLKNNYENKSKRIVALVEVHGGTYFVIGFQSQTYGTYIAFSYWDYSIIRIICKAGNWSYKSI